MRAVASFGASCGCGFTGRAFFVGSAISGVFDGVMVPYRAAIAPIVRQTAGEAVFVRPAMAAVGLGPEQTLALINGAAGEVSIAAINSPASTVLAGDRDVLAVDGDVRFRFRVTDARPCEGNTGASLVGDGPLSFVPSDTFGSSASDLGGFRATDLLNSGSAMSPVFICD